MRARNIKPGFFKNPNLADAGPIVQLLFAGLWLLADKDGRLKDDPRVIKGELFPYYDADVHGGLTVLERLENIRRYVVGCVAVIEVLNFRKHQSPHHTEKASTLPAFPEETSLREIHGDATVSSPLDNSGNPSDSLIHRFSDSQIHICEDSPIHAMPSTPAAERETRTHAGNGHVERLSKEAHRRGWSNVRSAYPTSQHTANQNTDWGKANKAATQLVDDCRATWESLRTAAGAYATFCEKTGRAPMNVAAFFCSEKPYWQGGASQAPAPVAQSTAPRVQ